MLTGEQSLHRQRCLAWRVQLVEAQGGSRGEGLQHGPEAHVVVGAGSILNAPCGGSAPTTNDGVGISNGLLTPELIILTVPNPVVLAILIQ